MSKYREEIEKVHNNTDFIKTFAGVTELGEFVYQEHGSSVQPGLNYHIHYTNTKNEVFMLGGAHNPSSKIIEKVGGSKSLFKRYSEISSATKDAHPSHILANPTKNNYITGDFQRYFAQSLISTNADIFETSEDDFNEQNNLYTYIEFNWRITGIREEVMRDNQITINFVNGQLPGIAKNLSVLQFWRPPKNSVETLEKKLSLLKNT